MSNVVHERSGAISVLAIVTSTDVRVPLVLKRVGDPLLGITSPLSFANSSHKLPVVEIEREP